MVGNLLLLARKVRRSVGGDRAIDRVRPYYWSAVSRLTRRRGLSQVFSDGHSYQFDGRLFAWELAQFEPDVVGVLLKHATPDSICYDIGAHVGLMTLALARRVSEGSGHVFAFEPSPDNFEILERHLAMNRLASSATPRHALVGERTQDAVPFSCRRGEFTANSLARQQTNGITHSVPMVAIDDAVQSGLPAPDLIKIDVEGYELAVLRGMARTLAQRTPTVICALHPKELAALGTSTREVLSYMAGLGYAAKNLAGVAVRSAGFEEVVFQRATGAAA